MPTCKSHEFNSRFYGKVILKDNIEKPLLETISDILKKTFVIIGNRDNEFNPVDIFKSDYFILNYFNRLQVTHNIDNTSSTHLYKNSKNYSSFYFYKEIESIVNRICDELGYDSDFKKQYNPEIENLELDIF